MALGWLVAEAAFAQAPPAAEVGRRGPFEVREEWLLAQPRLALPALAPFPLARGTTAVRLDFDWGNDFGHRRRGYLVDGEHTALGLVVRRGFRDSLTLGLRLPILHRGGGTLDSLIDSWHRLTGLPDNSRPLYPRNELVIAGFHEDGQPLDWTGGPGTGLGKLELEALLSPKQVRDAAFTGAVAGRVAFPSGTGPFGGGGVEAGLQGLGAFRLSPRFDLYTGLGVTAGTSDHYQGIAYQKARVFGFLALEWRLGRRLSLLGQLDGASRLATDIAAYQGLQSYLRLGLKRDLGARTRFEAGVTENIYAQQATTDFGLFFALVRRF